VMSTNGHHGGSCLFYGYPTPSLTKAYERPGPYQKSSVKAYLTSGGPTKEFGTRCVLAETVRAGFPTFGLHANVGVADGQCYSREGISGPNTVQTTDLVGAVADYTVPAGVRFRRDGYPSINYGRHTFIDSPTIDVNNGIDSYVFGPFAGFPRIDHVAAVIAMKQDEGVEAYVYNTYGEKGLGAVDLTVPL